MQALRDNALLKLTLWLLVWAGCLPKSCEPQSCASRPAEPKSTDVDRRPELEERLRKTGECEGCSLRAVQLAGADLRGAHLRGAALRGDLRGTDFRGADLRAAELAGDLRGADFRGAQVTNIYFHDALLAGARLDGLDLRTLRGADGADWSGAVLVGTNLQRLAFVGWQGARHRPPARGCYDVPSGGTSLRGTDLRGADLSEALLSACDLRDADLRGAQLRGAVLPTHYEDVAGANFSGAHGPWGLRCAELSIGGCVPVGSPKERKEAMRRFKRYCAATGTCPRE